MKRLTREEVIKRAIEIHGNKYDYSLVNYISNKINIIIICPYHGKFTQTPDRHMRGNGCIKCGNNKKRDKFKKKLETFIIQSNKIHNKYDYSLSVYKNAHQKIKIICPKHGYFLQTPNHHLSGSGCPACANFVSYQSQKWLDLQNIEKDFREYKIFCKNRCYVVDGYNPITNTVYEFNGDFWHGNPTLYKPEDINPVNKLTFGDLYKQTIEKENNLKSIGYKVISIWESDFKEFFNKSINKIL